MLECVLCGHKYCSADEFEEYSYDRYLHEIDKRNLRCCKTCKEILRCQGSKHLQNKSIIKVKIKTSDYPIPGYVLSEDGTHYVRPSHKNCCKVNRKLGKGK
jgi:hypothetical protein